MDYKTPGLQVLHSFLEFAQTYVLCIDIPSNHLILGHPFFSCPQSFPETESFAVSWLFTSGGQSIIGASASALVLPVHIQG